MAAIAEFPDFVLRSEAAQTDHANRGGRNPREAFELNSPKPVLDRTRGPRRCRGGGWRRRRPLQAEEDQEPRDGDDYAIEVVEEQEKGIWKDEGIANQWGAHGRSGCYTKFGARYSA
ncbi:hypothetical protein HPP92_002290 [Vanilla planifolia]|uniref:Uncharacterized protein n=1 Tax=Vanilla planifolia TaxID=51239 RepID=A0A835SEE5_VANPL|nr:hypothetical protein HPP92_002290 [Vanilla planifolia]